METSLIASLPAPYAWFPLALIVGVILMHRYDDQLGALFIILSAVGAFYTEDYPTALGLLFSALVGRLMVRKLFALRSLYALLGLGLTLNAIYLTIETIVRWNTAWPRELFYQSIWMMLGLYFGLMLVKFAEGNFKRNFWWPSSASLGHDL